LELRFTLEGAGQRNCIFKEWGEEFVATVKDSTFLIITLQMGNVLVKCFVPICYCNTQEFRI